MKRLRKAAVVVSATAAVLLSALLLYSCSRNTVSGRPARTEDGLSIVRVFGANRNSSVAGENLQVSDWYSGRIPSRFWEQLNADLARNGVFLELDLIMPDQMGTSYQTLLASGRLNNYDFISSGSLSEANAQAIISQNRAYPLNKAFDEHSNGAARNYYNSDSRGLFMEKAFTVEDGNFYWVSNAQADYYLDPSYVVGSHISGMIRVDWLDALGLRIPQTLDEFYNALVAFQTNDMNKNGVRDEVAWISLENFSTGVAQWFGLGTGSTVALIDDRIVSPWYQPQVQDYIRYMQRLYQAGLVRTDSEGGAIEANRIGYLYTWIMATWNEPSVQVAPGTPSAEYAPFTLQAIPGGSPARVWLQSGYTKDMWLHFIPSGAANVAGAVGVFDYIVTQAYSDLTELGIEGYNFTRSSTGEVLINANPPNNVGIDAAVIAAQFPNMWAQGSILPRNRAKDMVQEVISCRAQGYEYKAAFAEANYRREWAFVQDLGSLTAFPSPSELARINDITPDLNTYSSELLTSLIMGEKSLDQWDSYMADLRRLGLDELINIYQARVDRLLR